MAEPDFNSLADVQSGSTEKPLMVTVVATGPVVAWKKNDTSRTLQKFVVVDTNDTSLAPVLAVSYAPHEDIEKHNVLVLEKYLYRKGEDKLVLTQHTKMDLGPIDATRAAAVEVAALNLLNPAAETVTISQAKTSPTKRSLSIEGQIVRDEGIRTVKVRDDPNVKIKTIIVGNSEKDRIAVSLWRDAATQELQVGQTVRLTNLVVNRYQETVSLNSSKDSVVTVNAAPAEEITVKFIGVMEVTTNHAILKCMKGGIYLPLTIPANLFTNFPCSKTAIRLNLPFTAKVLTSGNAVEEMTILNSD